VRIASFRIQNYKAFRDTGQIPLKAGVNIIVGKNDAGKSALLEAISLTHGVIPHRSLASLPTPDTPLNADNFVDLEFELSSVELMAYYSKVSDIALPALTDVGTTIEAFSAVLANGVRLKTRFQNGGPMSGHFSDYGSLDIATNFLFKNKKVPLGLELEHHGSSTQAPNYAYGLAPDLKGKMYAFKAERLNVGQSQVHASNSLSANAANLADVLNQLMTTNLAQWDKLMAHVRTIFPHITEVTSQMVDANNARVNIWSLDRSTMRVDLAVPLAQSGTGIGQILAMLYVVITSTTPRVIFIDEPQSFLHPGAVRKLMEILRGYQHQYIITTHAPTALDMRPSDNVLMVTRNADGSGSSIEAIDPSQTEHLRKFLLEVGARLSDVFGVDAILWVEGKTEEQCFPVMVQRLTATQLQGVKVVGVIATDELVAKDASRVFDIYSQLSSGHSLLPPAIGFVFDTEGRSPEFRKDVENKSGGRMQWLPRRMFENYLLNADAIAKLLTREDAIEGQTYDAEHIRGLIQTLSREVKYFERMPSAPEYLSEDWFSKIHGANLLSDLFTLVTDSRVIYRKVVHGMDLTESILEADPESLRLLAEWIANLIKGGALPITETT
jgi:AAA ATPase domain/AAA domain, putative AbiEii toxin, Type IV TA system